MRRQFLQTVARGAAALFVGDTIKEHNRSGGSTLLHYAPQVASGLGYDPSKITNPAMLALYEQISGLEARSYRYSNAYFSPDADLLNLGSVTPQWRASVTLSRETQRRGLIKTLNDKLMALRDGAFGGIKREVESVVMRAME